MYFYAVYAANLETIYVNEKKYTTDEFHRMCEEAPKIYTNGEWINSPSLIGQWLMEIYNFKPVPYTATYYAY